MRTEKVVYSACPVERASYPCINPMGLLDEYEKNPQVTPAKSASPAPTDSEDGLEELPGMIRWMARHSGGLIKNKAQASYAVIGIVAVAIVFLFYNIF